MRSIRALAVAAFLALIVLPSCEAVFDVDEKRLVPPPAPAPPPPGARPPARPTGSSTGPSEAIAFAAAEFYFGAIDPDTGARDANAWRKIGYDVDGVHTTAEHAARSRAPGTCRRPSDANIDSLVDGHEGRDNNFGSQALKIAATVSAGPESIEVGIKKGVAKGSPTFLVVLQDLNAGPDDPEVHVGLYVTSSTKAPDQTGIFRYPIDSRSVAPGSITPKMTFVHGYMTNHTVVSGDFNAPSETALLFPFDPAVGTAVTTPLAVTLVLQLDPTHRRVLSSTVSLVLATNDVVAMLMPAAVRFGLASCGPGGQATLFGIARRLADLRSDRPSFLDPSGTTECDAISLALRLGWFRVRVPLIENVVVVPPTVDPCAAKP
jgi:hypothetical protein